MKKITALLCLPLMFSCEKTINYEIPRESSKFSIDSRIMTGDRVQVFVAHTEYSLSAREPQVVSDAKVVLIEDGVPLTQMQWISNSPESGYYQTPLRPAAGKTYRIEVSNEKYGLASGEAFSLTPTGITGWDIDTSNLKINLSFTDDGSTKDYYSIRIYADDGGNQYPLFLASSDPGVDFFYDFGDDFFGDNLKRGYAAYVTDEAFNGKIKTVKFEELYYDSFGGWLPDAVILEVTRISEDHYLHERSKGAQYVAGDNPFAEPVQIYSNITNGYGIVAAGAPARVRISL